MAVYATGRDTETIGDTVPATQQLRAEHAELARLTFSFERLIALPSPPPPVDLFELRQTFSKKLFAHLMAEDWMLYPELLRSHDPAVALKAQEFMDEMGGLVDAYKAWSNAWPAGAVKDNWKGFAAETRDLLDALKLRIARENRELYPMFEDQAAKAA